MTGDPSFLAGERDGRAWFATLSDTDRWHVGDALVLAGSSDLSADACAETGRSDDPTYRAGWRRGVRRASDAWEAAQ